MAGPRFALMLAMAVLTALGAGTPGHAEDYPARPVKIISTLSHG